MMKSEPKSKPKYPMPGQKVWNVRGIAYFVDAIQWYEGHWRIKIGSVYLSRAAFAQYFSPKWRPEC